MSNEETNLFAGSIPAMRTTPLEVIQVDEPIDFTGDCAASVFITKLRLLPIIPVAFLIGQLQRPFGLERRFERY